MYKIVNGISGLEPMKDDGLHEWIDLGNGRSRLVRKNSNQEKFTYHPKDMIDEIDHPAYSDGRKTSSKSEFRKWTKEAGCVELGNDRMNSPKSQKRDLTKDVIKAYKMVQQGYRPKILDERNWND